MNPRSLNQWIDPVGCNCCSGYKSGAYGCVIKLLFTSQYGDMDKEIIAIGQTTSVAA